MKIPIHVLAAFLFFLSVRPASAAPYSVECQSGAGDYVVLVHGLDWFRNTMDPAAEYLHDQGYETINVRYPSRRVADPRVAARWVAEVVRGHCQDPKKRIHLVAHSMGALVVREYLAAGKPARLGRVVLLAAPNHGTPLAEPLKWKPLAKMISPAAAASCRPKPGTPKPEIALGYAPGILMGNRSGWFPFLSPFIDGPDDGVVPVASGRLQGMADFRVLTTSHTSMPHYAGALHEVVAFLRDGRFSPQREKAPVCGS
jgi:triacylglycerol lipase